MKKNKLDYLAKEVVDSLKSSGLYITTVESCTGGGLANWITNISESSNVFTSAKVTYSNKEKIILGVPEEIIEKFGVYSNETAIAMAEAGIRCADKADIGVGITGSISRPDPANEGSQPGEIYIAVRYNDETISRVFNFNENERWEVKDEIIECSLFMILEILNETAKN
jgi:nicotinamide-nucleotide amidase